MEAYEKHAYIWDWDGFDNSNEYKYWCKYAEKFGKKVLLPMCALGESGNYMAQKGFMVTAFDITEKMIIEGKQRFGSTANLTFETADICSFSFRERAFDFSFITNQDLHLLPTVNDVEKALASIQKHLRMGGCLVLELLIGSDKSAYYPKQIFHPRVTRFNDKKIWKESESRYDGQTKTNHISQEVYVEDINGVEHFNYSICLHYFERSEILAAIKKAGFKVVNEFCSRDREEWAEGKQNWILELIK